MSQRLGWYLFTDPSFEQAYNHLKQRGFMVNVIARDSFEETVASGLFEVERATRTVLGTPFDTALDRKHGEMLITTDIPLTEKGEMPAPHKDLYTLSFNEMRFGLAKRDKFSPVNTILASEQMLQKWAVRDLVLAKRVQEKALRLQRERAVRRDSWKIPQ